MEPDESEDDEKLFIIKRIRVRAASQSPYDATWR